MLDIRFQISDKKKGTHSLQKIGQLTSFFTHSFYLNSNIQYLKSPDTIRHTCNLILLTCNTCACEFQQICTLVKTCLQDFNLKMKLLYVFLIASILFITTNAHAQITVVVDSPTQCEPAGYSGLHNYYLPDVQAY